MEQLYDNTALRRLVAEGMPVPRTGTYGLWVWAKQGAHVHLRVSDQSLPPTHTAGPSCVFYWQRAGEVKLEAGAPAPVSLRAQARLDAGDPDPGVGYLAVSDLPDFDPRRGFQLSRVFTKEPGPTPDARLRSYRHGEQYFPFPGYRDRPAWLARAAYLREHMLVSLGLWPMPEKCPLNARVFGRVHGDGYTIEKVYFESWPGFYVTGNLYRPTGRQAPFPGILNPHGHWENGRLEDSRDGSVPGRCINFALQGYVAFSYDMIGYNDSFQLQHGGGSPLQSLWGISRMGLQCWNSIRAVDFIASLEDVDADRIACTGASGGGTQTYTLAAVDDRVKVAAPVCMVSSFFQGGCVCENAPGLRLDTFNTELAALIAPRPLLLVAVTGDWTEHTPDVEYPALRSIYRLFDAEEKLRCEYFDADHNYNRDAREAVYAWFGRWLLGVDDEEQLKERPFAVPPKERLLVFHGMDKPANALDEEGLTRLLTGNARRSLESSMPRSAPGLDPFRRTASVALTHVLGACQPAPAELERRAMGRVRRAGFVAEPLLIGRTGHGDQIPGMLYTPKGSGQPTRSALLVHPQGKAAFVDAEQGEPGRLVPGLLDSGTRVLAIDPFLTGEFHSPFGSSRREQDVLFFDTFNPTDLACRVQDILTAIAYLGAQAEGSDVRLAGFGIAGLWALLACGFASGLKRAVVDASGFDVADDHRWVEDMYAPGLRRAGGFAAAGVLAAPTPLFLHHTAGVFDTGAVQDAYRLLGAQEALRIEEDRAAEDEVLSWLCKE